MRLPLISLIILVYTSVGTYGQVKTIDVQPGPEHSELPGTKYLIIKPDDSFRVSSDFTGLQSEKWGAWINITEMPFSFELFLSMISKDMPPDNGKLLLEEDLLMNGYRAKLYKSDIVHKSEVDKLDNPDQPGKPLIAWLLVYGDEKRCFTLAASYPNTLDDKLSEKFEKSLKSFLYQDDKEVNSLDGLVFQVDVSGTPLQFATILMQTGVGFNMDGKFPPESEDKTNYLVMVLPFAVAEAEQKEKAIKTVQKPLLDNVELKEVNPISLGGLSGYEVIGTEKDEKEGDRLIYSVLLFDKNRHFRISASSQSEFEEKIEMFRKIGQTFILKK